MGGLGGKIALSESFRPYYLSIICFASESYSKSRSIGNQPYPPQQTQNTKDGIPLKDDLQKRNSLKIYTSQCLKGYWFFITLVHM